MTTSSTAEADAVALDKDLSSFTHLLFFPLMLVLNFSFFQYLVLLFHTRWREERVLMLLLVSAISVGLLVPSATQRDATVANLNGVSESCLALILLVQTALVSTRHALQGNRVWRYDHDQQCRGEWDTGVHVCLPLRRTGDCKGWKKMAKDDKLEIVCHMVFTMHEYPSMLLKRVTHVSWKQLQAIFMRLVLTPCVWMTIDEHHTQRVSGFFDLQNVSVSGVDLKVVVRRASLDAAATRGGGNEDEKSGYHSHLLRLATKSSAVIDARLNDDDDSPEEKGCATTPVASEEIRSGHVAPIIDSSAAHEDETLNDRVDDKFSQDHI